MSSIDTWTSTLKYCPYGLSLILASCDLDTPVEQLHFSKAVMAFEIVL